MDSFDLSEFVEYMTIFISTLNPKIDHNKTYEIFMQMMMDMSGPDGLTFDDAPNYARAILKTRKKLH